MQQTSPFTIAFEVGQIYDRRADLHTPFGGSLQNGISASARSPVIFLFTGESGKQFGYHDSDGYDEFGVFHYTGEGQTGHMSLTGGNLAVLNHSQDGRSLHLFRALGKKKGKSLGQRYLGEFVCANHSWHEGPDKKGDTRKIVVFHLAPIGRVDEAAIGASSDETVPMTLAEARSLAVRSTVAEENATPGSAIRNLYKRSVRVKNYVLMRAAGNCESCNEEAPFKRKDGSPYLEPHHINRLSDGGLDHPRYIGAICPSCHREIHYGANGEAKNNQLREYVELLESK